MSEMQRLSMEVEIGQFYIWKETNNIKAKEILLWHALMYLAYSAGWPKWMSIPISTLESKTGLKRDAIYSARDNLEKMGRIQIIPGKGSKAAQYKIIPFIEDYYQENEYLNINNNIPNNIKLEELPPEEPTREKSKKTNIFKKIQELVPMPSSMDIHYVKSWLDEGMNDDLLCEAIEISTKELSDKKPMEQWNYAKGIMRNWYNNGIKTLEEYLEHERERKERMTRGGNKQNNRPARPTTTAEPKESGMREFRIPD